MALPDTDLQHIRRWAQAKTPPRLLNELRLEVDVDVASVTVFDYRPPWHHDADPTWTRRGIDRLRWTIKYGTWTLHCADRHGKWHRYDRTPPSARIATQLAEIDNDPTAISCG